MAAFNILMANLYNGDNIVKYANESKKHAFNQSLNRSNWSPYVRMPKANR